MDRQEKEKIIAVLEIVKDAIERYQNKIQDNAQAPALSQYLKGEHEAYEAMLRFLQTGCAAYLTMWCDTQQKRMIDDIVNNRMKV